MQREVFVGGAKACNEMIFVGANGAFGCVAAMDAGGDKLVVDLLFVEKFFEDVGAFIVETG